MGKIPTVPSGVLPDSGYDKLNSTTPEQKHLRSPARPQVRQWATPSYDPQTGRAQSVEHFNFNKAVQARQAHKPRHDGPISWEQLPGETRDYSADKKPTKPGRW